MSLYHCTANGVFGSFGDYVWATNAAEARLKFWRLHKITPLRISLERRAA